MSHYKTLNAAVLQELHTAGRQHLTFPELYDELGGKEGVEVEESVSDKEDTSDVSPLPHVPNSPSTVGTIYVLIPCWRLVLIALLQEFVLNDMY